jgi:hypothetical protein
MKYIKKTIYIVTKKIKRGSPSKGEIPMSKLVEYLKIDIRYLKKSK